MTTPLNQRKHPHMILAIDSSFFTSRPEVFNSNLTKVNILDYELDMHSHLVLRERQALEKNPNYRQLLPYIVLRHVDTDTNSVYYFTYRRTSKVGEQRLTGNVSIGIGGHIDFIDVATQSLESNAFGVLDLRETLTDSACREIYEEVGLNGHGLDVTTDLDMETNLSNYDYVILDDSNEVGTVHVGLVKIFNIDKEMLGLACLEEELETVGFKTAKHILESEPNIENWTRILLEEFAKHDPVDGVVNA